MHFHASRLKPRNNAKARLYKITHPSGFSSVPLDWPSALNTVQLCNALIGGHRIVHA